MPRHPEQYPDIEILEPKFAPPEETPVSDDMIESVGPVDADTSSQDHEAIVQARRAVEQASGVPLPQNEPMSQMEIEAIKEDLRNTYGLEVNDAGEPAGGFFNKRRIGKEIAKEGSRAAELMLKLMKNKAHETVTGLRGRVLEKRSKHPVPAAERAPLAPLATDGAPEAPSLQSQYDAFVKTKGPNAEHLMKKFVSDFVDKGEKVDALHTAAQKQYAADLEVHTNRTRLENEPEPSRPAAPVRARSSVRQPLGGLRGRLAAGIAGLATFFAFGGGKAESSNPREEVPGATAQMNTADQEPSPQEIRFPEETLVASAVDAAPQVIPPVEIVESETAVEHDPTVVHANEGVTHPILRAIEEHPDILESYMTAHRGAKDKEYRALERIMKKYENVYQLNDMDLKRASAAIVSRDFRDQYQLPVFAEKGKTHLIVNKPDRIRISFNDVSHRFELSAIKGKSGWKRYIVAEAPEEEVTEEAPAVVTKVEPEVSRQPEPETAKREMPRQSAQSDAEVNARLDEIARGAEEDFSEGLGTSPSLKAIIKEREELNREKEKQKKARGRTPVKPPVRSGYTTDLPPLPDPDGDDVEGALSSFRQRDTVGGDGVRGKEKPKEKVKGKNDASLVRSVEQFASDPSLTVELQTSVNNLLTYDRKMWKLEEAVMEAKRKNDAGWLESIHTEAGTILKMSKTIQQEITLTNVPSATVRQLSRSIDGLLKRAQEVMDASSGTRSDAS